MSTSPSQPLITSVDLTKSYFCQCSCWWNHWIQPKGERASGYGPGPLLAWVNEPQLGVDKITHGFSNAASGLVALRSNQELACSSSPDQRLAPAWAEETIKERQTALPAQHSLKFTLTGSLWSYQTINSHILRQIQHGLKFGNCLHKPSVENQLL